MFLPSWATSFNSNGPFDEKYNGPYEPNNLYCIESLDENSVFTIDSSLDNVIIVANCIVSVAAGLDLNNVIICSTAFLKTLQRRLFDFYLILILIDLLKYIVTLRLGFQILLSQHLFALQQMEIY